MIFGRSLPGRALAGLALASCVLVRAASVAPVPAENGMVVTAHPIATQVGVEILRQGGNAVDAAVAVGYALAVVYPIAGNLGGGGFATLHLADGRDTFIDFRETAPLAARRDMYLDASGNVMQGASLRGHLAVAVPGSVAGLEHLREKYATMKREPLVAPALELADKGFALGAGDVALLAIGIRDLANDPPSAAIFLNQGAPWRAGQRLVQKDLAATLRLIVERGRDGFYKPPVSEAIVKSSRAGGGILSQADFDAYKTRVMKPLECDYRGYRIVSAPPPSSGGTALCEIFHILEGYPLAQMGFRSAQAVHVQIEAMRHAFYDRNHALGDPDFVNNPLARLLDRRYAARIREAIDTGRAGDSRDIPKGALHEGTSTTHFSIADRHGNAIAVTYTLNESWGARVTAAGTGVLLNNEMDDFTVKVGEANLFGLVQGAQNAIEPGKRPLSSMSPTLVFRDGKPVMVVGTPGGSRIISAVLHTILNVVDYGMDIQEAVDAPRFHQQWIPEATGLERFALSPDTQKLLEAKGHKFGPAVPITHVCAILIGAPSLGGRPVGKNRFYGAHDPRGKTGLALGY
jgi:gamma-glutamyltranspeptidase/glutathione hydrolase